MPDQYKLYGYDKDAGIEELLLEANRLDIAKFTGAALMEQQAKTDKIKSKAGEPYDWFLLYQNNCLIVRFTANHRKGRSADHD